jgi:hypothetical protein
LFSVFDSYDQSSIAAAHRQRNRVAGFNAMGRRTLIAKRLACERGASAASHMTSRSIGPREISADLSKT